MRGKGLKKWGWIGIAICLFLPASGYAKNDAKNYNSNIPNNYAMETILAQPDKLENEWVRLVGYAKFEEDGIILYYTERDYRYDTKENAIWLPERPERPIEKYFGDMNEINDGEVLFIDAVILPKENTTYAVEALYVIDDEDEVWENAEPLPTKIKKYDREEENEKAQRISIYRLLGDPWSYDGEKVCVDIRGAHEWGYDISSESRYTELGCTNDIYGETIAYIAPWNEIVKEYEQDNIFKDTNADVQRYAEVAAYVTRVQMEIEMMFYMYEVSEYSIENTAVNYRCWPCKITISDTGKQKWEMEMKELYSKFKDRWIKEI